MATIIAVAQCLLAVVLGTLNNVAAASNVPFFVHDMDGLRISETIKTGSVVYQLVGKSDASEVYYGIEGDDHFSVDPKAGIVTLVNPLNFERNSALLFYVTLQDLTPDGHINSTKIKKKVVVSILDANNQSPVFGNTLQPFMVDVPKDSKVGAVVLPGIVVSDADSVGSPLTLTCTAFIDAPDVCSWFGVQIQFQTTQNLRAALILTKPLSSVERDVIHFALNASDGLHSTYEEVYIKLTNSFNEANNGDIDRPPPFHLATSSQNHYRPVFNRKVLIGSVRDDQPSGAAIIFDGLQLIVSDADKAPCNAIDLSIRQINSSADRSSSSPFSIYPTRVNGSGEINIILANASAIDAKAFRDVAVLFEVVAHDLCSPANEETVLPVLVTPIEINQPNSYFDSSAYAFSLYPNAPPNASLGSIRLRQQLTNSSREIVYQLSGVCADCFSAVSSADLPVVVDIKVKSCAKSETCFLSSQNLILNAADRMDRTFSSDVLVTIDVVKTVSTAPTPPAFAASNESGPTTTDAAGKSTTASNDSNVGLHFLQMNYIAKLDPLNGLLEPPVQVKAVSMSNFMISYKIEGNLSEVFHVDQTSGEIVVDSMAEVRSSSQRRYQFDVMAIAKDANDDIMEEATASVIVDVLATNSKLPQLQFFKANNATDTDLPQPSLFQETNLSDVNSDSGEHFDIRFEIGSDLKIGTKIGNILEKGFTNYSILLSHENQGENFAVEEESGDLIYAGGMLIPGKNITLHVMSVQDRAPFSHMEKKILIRIKQSHPLKESRMAPLILKPNENSVIYWPSLADSKNKYLVTLLLATDNDSNNIEFSLKSTDPMRFFDVFMIESLLPEFCGLEFCVSNLSLDLTAVGLFLKINPTELLMETNTTSVKMHLIATDATHPDEQSTNVHFTVTFASSSENNSSVTPINSAKNESMDYPIFEESNVSAQLANAGVVGAIVANVKVMPTLRAYQLRLDGAYAGYFQINNTGVVVQSKLFEPDFNVSSFDLKVVACFELTPSVTNNATLTIELVNESSSVSKFVESVYKNSVFDSVPVGNQILPVPVVSGFDRHSLHFSLLNVPLDINDSLSIDSSEGIVTTVKKLTGKSGLHKFTILATDALGHNATAAAEFNILPLIGENCKPQISGSRENVVRILQTSEPGHVIASAKDLFFVPPGCRFVYLLNEPPSSKFPFKIDAENATITLTSALANDSIDSYNVTITAMQKDSNFDQHINLEIMIDKVYRSNPQFLDQKCLESNVTIVDQSCLLAEFATYNFAVDDSLPAGAELVRIKAVSWDSRALENVHYFKTDSPNAMLFSVENADRNNFAVVSLNQTLPLTGYPYTLWIFASNLKLLPAQLKEPDARSVNASWAKIVVAKKEQTIPDAINSYSKSSYKIAIPLDMTPATVFYSIKPSSNLLADLQYRISSSNYYYQSKANGAEGMFALDARTGDVKLNASLNGFGDVRFEVNALVSNERQFGDVVSRNLSITIWPFGWEQLVKLSINSAATVTVETNIEKLLVSAGSAVGSEAILYKIEFVVGGNDSQLHNMTVVWLVFLSPSDDTNTKLLSAREAVARLDSQADYLRGAVPELQVMEIAPFQSEQIVTSKKSLSSWAIAVIVVVAVLIIAVLFSSCLLCYFRKVGAVDFSDDSPSTGKKKKDYSGFQYKNGVTGKDKNKTTDGQLSIDDSFVQLPDLRQCLYEEKEKKLNLNSESQSRKEPSWAGPIAIVDVPDYQSLTNGKSII